MLTVDLMSNNTYSVLSYNLPKLKAKVAAFARRAAKQGLDPQISLEVLGESLQPEIVNGEKTGAFLSYTEVCLSGAAPVISGWEFAARIEHHKAGNIVSCAPGSYEVDLPASLREGGSFCEHCNLTRNRKDTYVLRHVETGEVQRVGRTCLQDFLRSEDLGIALAIWTLMGQLSVISGEGASGAGDRAFPVRTLVERSFRAVALHGWTSRAAALRCDRVATADLVLDTFSSAPAFDADAREARAEIIVTTPANREDTASALDWVAANTDRSDYMHNLRVACSEEHVSYRNVGLVCSLVSAYARHIEREITKQSSAPSAGWFGKVGVRYVRELTITGRRDLDGEYGTVVLYTLQDAAGHKFKWFSSGGLFQDGEIVGAGFAAKLQFTVKKHSEFKGVQESVITRGSVSTKDPKRMGSDGEVFKTKKAMTASL